VEAQAEEIKSRLGGERGAMVSNADLRFIHFYMYLFTLADLLKIPNGYCRSDEGSERVRPDLEVLARESMVMLFRVVSGLGGGDAMLRQALIGSEILIKEGCVCGHAKAAKKGGVCEKERKKGYTGCSFHSFDLGKLIKGP